MMTKLLAAAGLGAAMLAIATLADAAPIRVPAGLSPFAIVMRYHHSDEIETLIRNQTDPGSPVYAKFLTADEFRRYFAPTPAEYASTIVRLRQAGFVVTATSANRTVIDVAATQALVNQKFGVKPNAVRAGAAPQFASFHPVMAGEFPLVQAVVSPHLGLGGATARHTSMPLDLERLRTAHHGRGYGPSVGPDGGFGPAAIIKGLNFPLRHGYDGRGIKVADVIDGAPSDADIQVFLDAFGLKRTGPPTTVVPIDGGDGPDPELADIDAEWIVSTAPAVSLYAYDMAYFDSIPFVDALNQVVSDNIVDVVNTSLSRIESDAVDMALAVQPIIAQGACQGIAFETVSFGTVNVSEIPDALFPLVPADSADELDVSASNAIEDEKSQIVAQSGFYNSGGGISAIVPVFPAQLRIGGVDPSGRNVPDISLVSEVNGNGASLYIDGGWYGGQPFVSNTPAASLLAEYQQMLHHRLGAFNRVLYHQVTKHGYGQGIIDITSGCNGMYLGSPVCAHAGYDLTSGIGSFADAYRFGRTLR